MNAGTWKKSTVRFHRSARGASLVELLVAVAIIGTALVVFVAALSTGSLSTGELGQEAEAQRLAQRQLERIKGAEYDATGASYSLIPAPSGFGIALDVNSSIYADNNIQKISVTVSKDAQPVLVVEDYKVNR